MTDTINSMEMRFADLLYPNQLMEGDLIKVEGMFFIVKNVDEGEEGCNVSMLDDFDELIETFFFDDEQIELYVYVEQLLDFPAKMWAGNVRFTPFTQKHPITLI